MPNIKIKPQMDKPKLRPQNKSPKDAGALMRQEYEDRQRQRQPGQKGPVQYATDQVETTGRPGTAATADGMRRVAEKTAARKQDRKTPRSGGEVPASAPKSAPRQIDNLSLQTPGNSDSVKQSRQLFLQERREQMTKANVQPHDRLDSGALPYRNGGKLPSFSPAPQETPSHSPEPKRGKAAPRERGRQLTVRNARERRKRAPNLAEKEDVGRTAGRTFSPKVEKSAPASMSSTSRIKQGFTHRSRVTHSTGQPAANRARQAVQRRAQKKMFAQTAAGAKNAAKKGGQMIAQAAAAGRAVASAFGTIAAAGGGIALLVMLMVVILIGAIAASPFGILFSGENTTADTVPVSAAIAQVQYDFNVRLEALQTADEYDDVTLTGDLPDWTEVIAVFAVKVAGSDSADATDVATIDADRVTRLKAIFADMCLLSQTVDVTDHPDSTPDDEVDDSWTEKVLNITITPKHAEDMKVAYGFSARQITALEELLAQRDLLLELVGSLASVSAQAAEIARNLPEDLSPERKEVVKTACSLVGKVNYFWGGKSSAIGWDNRWGQLHEVTAADSPTTGTYRPFGMDCSGYVDWVFNNSLGYVIGHGGGAHTQHTYCTDITWNDAQPGDLVFYPDDEHIGIVAGKDDAGELLVIHCASGYNNVVITGKEGFTAIARPNIFTEEA